MNRIQKAYESLSEQACTLEEFIEWWKRTTPVREAVRNALGTRDLFLRVEGEVGEHWVSGADATLTVIGEQFFVGA